MGRGARGEGGRARAGEGPTLLDVTCPDPPSTGPVPAGPRSIEDEDAAWAAADPLARAAELVPEAEALKAKAVEDVERAAEAALALPAPPAPTLFEDVFASRTPALDRQRDEHLKGR